MGILWAVFAAIAVFKSMDNSDIEGAYRTVDLPVSVTFASIALVYAYYSYKVMQKLDKMNETYPEKVLYLKNKVIFGDF